MNNMSLPTTPVLFPPTSTPHFKKEFEYNSRKYSWYQETPSFEDSNDLDYSWL